MRPSTLARLGWLAALTLSLAGCQAKPSPAAREQAAVEGRNLAGSSPASRDDRIPELEADAIGAEAGCLPGAFAYASAPARLIAWALARAGAEGRLGPELGEALAAHPSARLRASVAALTPAAGIHLRVHVDDPELGAATLASLREGFGEGEGSCPELERSLRWCDRGPERLTLVRLDAAGLILDQLVGPGVASDDSTSLARVRAALDRTSEAAPAELAALRGDAVAWVDASGLEAAGPAVAAGLGGAPDSFARLAAEPRLLDGITLELELTGARVLGRLRWRVQAGAEDRVAEVFTLDPVDADVPSLASLCAGQRVCVRTRGLPVASRFAGLATGLYADPSALADAVAAAPELAALSLALSGWPHAIASILRWPSGAHDPGVELGEAMVRNTLAEIAGRVLGFGLAHGDAGTLVYARVSGLDLTRLRDYLALAGAAFAPVALAQIEGRLEAGATPGAGRRVAGLVAPRRSYVHFDPGEAWGWLVLADDDGQLGWLAARTHDDGAVPIVYVELADLGDATGRAGLRGTSVRAQLSATPARVPQLRFWIGALP